MPDLSAQSEEYVRIPTRLDGIPGVPGHTRVASVRGYDLCCRECSMAARGYVAWPCMGVIRHLSDMVLDNVRTGLLGALHDPWDFRCTERDPDKPSKPAARCLTCRTPAKSEKEVLNA